MTPNDTEEHRAACEARWLASRTPNEITEFLALVAKMRSKEAAEKLRTDAREAWRLQNTKNG